MTQLHDNDALNAAGPSQGVRDPLGGSVVHEVTSVGALI